MNRFSFDKALSWAFSAPHAGSYFVLYPLLYALAYLVLFGIIGAIGYAMWPQFASAFQILSDADSGDADPAAVISAFGSLLVIASPLILIASIGSWLLWAVFEAASQRRFVRGDKFSLGFGADELRLMWVGFLFGLMGFVLFILAFGVVIALVVGVGAAAGGGADPDSMGAAMVPAVIIGIFLAFGAFCLYVFYATRLAPCFGLTIKDRKAKFLSAWGVSRGRFWPILGAFVILAIAGGIVVQIIQSIAQALLLPTLMNLDFASGDTPDFSALATPGFIISAAIALFVMMAVQGLYVHVIAAPAAFAARHDPKGGVEDTVQLEAFS